MKTRSHAIMLLPFVLLQALGVLAGDTMSPGMSISRGDNLTSARNVFVLGFFSRSASTTYYLGIWYAVDPDVVVWVANRNASLPSSAGGELTLTDAGELQLLSNATSPRIVWNASRATPSAAQNPVLRLLDSGNLILTDLSDNATLWQSFDEPSDTSLPGMKLGTLNLASGGQSRRRLVSWRSATDPSPGDYVYEMAEGGVPEFYLRQGEKVLFRTGPWNGDTFSGYPDLLQNSHLSYTFVSNRSGVYYYTTEPPGSRNLSRAFVNPAARSYQRCSWNLDRGEWTPNWSVPQDLCDSYNTCGSNSVCSVIYTTVSCDCLQGFAEATTGSGCERRRSLSCASDKFWAVQHVKLPDTANATAVRGPSGLSECRDWCSRTCSCSAYAWVRPSGCVAWTGDLWDLRAFAQKGNDVLFVRLSASEFGSDRKTVLIITIPLVVGFLLMLCLGLLIWRRRHRRKQGSLRTGTMTSAKIACSELDLSNTKETGNSLGSNNLSHCESARQVSTSYSDSSVPHLQSIISDRIGIWDGAEGQVNIASALPSFDLPTIKVATNDFSDDNKLGEGGFGVVYMGQLQDGQRIAVKKLSRWSSQGPDEFRNELTLIANLQHRNLVRLLGYCIEGDERILILEYMEKKSLDGFIYGKSQGASLNWQKRLDIIVGIARGLLYLHQDSNLRVIHRDLKLSNILLDKDMTPKISDFGIARIFQGDTFHETATSRPIGTFGYMAPEYITSGIFSCKSDVFSFGVLVLEILSGI
ncbi:G-type lectin S-receptor-like serine/threonine-protein kinase B120 isoform X2 [Curcuma longa]|uniref:G-type lectin S-receptor-like serine/threonine-protein kinase B120 isoform X2 n=1 Tax=Curcuma longa TaxID=136217 RepID=UPI003D9E30CB